MSTAIFSQRKMLETKVPDHAYDGSDEQAIRLAGLDRELTQQREELAALRQSFVEREKKTTKLIDAYKTVLSDMADLIESERQENVKREESLRFFMTSMETRLKNEIRAELGIEADDEDAPANSWWPFRKFR